MYPDQYFAPEQPISDDNGKCRVLRYWKDTAAILVVGATALAVLLAPARPALATVQTSGITYAYFDDPVTGNRTYGLPFFGNDVDFFPGIPPTIPDNAETFEYNAVAGPAGTTMDNEIIVGKGARGDLVISGSSILRAEHLIIGDVGVVGIGGGGNPRGGLGIVRVTGFASTYNNDPNITRLHPSVIEVSGWTSIRDPAAGYDLYVGRGDGMVGGTGELEISAGGSMEIQDAVILAGNPFTRATVNVDGFDSSLTSGGFDGGNANDPHLMIVGRQGIATMTVSNGGTVVSEAPPAAAGGGAQGPFGAAIGSIPFEGNMRPGQIETGGQGLVTITGVGSDWIIGGSLQIGGFHDPSTGMTPSISGELAEYNTTAGKGTLRVNDGGYVSIREAINPGQQAELLLAIGRFGRVELNGGWVSVGGIEDQGQSVDAEVVLLNDGVITGSGRIDTGVFRNRFFGELRVNAAEKLIISSSAEFIAPPDLEPLLNFGLIEVIGTVDARAELEFERSPGTTTPPRPVQRLINRLVILPMPGVEFNGGIINAQHATLHFGSGIFNEGTIGFTVGTNIVKGPVINTANLINGFAPRVLFEKDTTTVFYDEFSPGLFPAFQHPTARVIFLDNGFTSVGLNMGLTLSNPIPISAAGDIGLNGPINLTLEGDVVSDLVANGPRTYTLISFGGEAYYPTFNTEDDVWEPDYSAPLPDCGSGGPCGLFTTILPGISTLGPAFANHLPVTQRIGQSIVLSFVELSSIGVTLVGDYNNDGVVDAADYVVWRKNEGTMNTLPNDPFGGTIGQNQYDAWRANFGDTFPGSGAGGGLGANVPEPTALALLVSAGMLALALRRRRLR